MSGTGSRRRQSPAVYRRRRIALVLGVIVVGVVIWLLIAQPWRGAATEDVRPAAEQTQEGVTELPVPDSTQGVATTGDPVTETPSAETTRTPPPTPAANACTRDEVKVEAVTDSDAYGSGQNPQLSIRLTNTSSEACSLNVGTSSQTFAIKSGDDTWWRSTDCQAQPSDQIVMIGAGQTVSSVTPLAWDRTRSAVDTCGDVARETAPGGGASYHLSVAIGGIPSSGSAQFLLY